MLCVGFINVTERMQFAQSSFARMSVGRMRRGR